MRNNISFCALLFLICAFSLSAIGEPTSVAFVGGLDSSTENIADSTSEMARAVRMLSSPPLVRESADGTIKDSRFVPAIVNYLSVNEIRKEITFGFSQDLRLSSGVVLSISDLRASLERCKQRAVITTSITVEPKDLEDESMMGVKISGVDPKLALSEFAQCPIYSSEALKRFGKFYGEGTNIVGAGSWVVTKHLPNGSIWLVGEKDEQLSFVLVPHESDGLNVLRTGGVGAVVVHDDSTLEAVKNDQTLLQRECGSYRLVYRRGEEISCLELL